MEYIIILLHATSHALRAEKLLRKAGISCKLIPVPRQFSSDCGVCLRVERGDKECVVKLLEGANVEIDKIHQM